MKWCLTHDSELVACDFQFCTGLHNPFLPKANLVKTKSFKNPDLSCLKGVATQTEALKKLICSAGNCVIKEVI